MSVGSHITTNPKNGWSALPDNVEFLAPEPPNLGVRRTGVAFYEPAIPLNSVLNRALEMEDLKKRRQADALQSKVRGTTKSPARYYKRGRWAPQKERSNPVQEPSRPLF